jgi:hypothetical protein
MYSFYNIFVSEEDYLQNKNKHYKEVKSLNSVCCENLKSHVSVIEMLCSCDSQDVYLQKHNFFMFLWKFILVKIFIYKKEKIQASVYLRTTYQHFKNLKFCLKGFKF